MVEKINMQKIISPTSSASIVKKVNRQDADAEHRHFDRQLQEEDEKNKEDKRSGHAFESTGIGDSKKIGKEPAEMDNREDWNFDKTKKTGDNTQGKLIDIHV